MSDKIRVNELLDYYGALLTPRQQTLCNYYFRDDYSLSEIAELEGISKAAVSDTVRKCENEMEHYESILRCIHAAGLRRAIYKRMIQDSSCSEYVRELAETELIGGEYE
ncbi:MAG: DNA-binding protein [Solobacterium sp.]|nr:DNA-binding protein [Solobacterium sp.]